MEHTTHPDYFATRRFLQQGDALGSDAADWWPSKEVIVYK